MGLVFTQVWLESGGKRLKWLIVRWIKWAVGNRIWTIYPLIQEIRKVSYAFPHIEWNWIPRKRNRAAHIAASIGARPVELESWVN
ncbi:PREDICTED: PRUPE_2G216600 [Prunus dulcis]|uniref:PREDICTED: PRUPE_2G216600 n=1 Tax=Prunus dulcis TaxID=3755 RepID=A0A5E4FUV0_PRUDU|nr:PREDICTED: PRUPE_2G216600 [Prunus dulcis]